MSKLEPNPENGIEPRNASEGQESQSPRRRAGIPIPRVEEILQQLIQLNGAVLMGAISPKVAGLIQKNLKTILDVQLKRSSSGDSGPSQEALLDLCRRDPSMISVVEPFLTDEQLQSLMGEVMDDPDDTV